VGRTAQAAAAAPFPRTRRQAVPPSSTRLTAHAEPLGRPPAPGMLSPRKLPVKGAAYGRVPPLRSGQTPDSELPRQDLAPAGRTEQTGTLDPGVRTVVSQTHRPRSRRHGIRPDLQRTEL